MKIIPTILCGGSGTRLWPLSRTHAPKQLQALTNEKSLLANTVLRLELSKNCTDPVLICGRSYAEQIENQLMSVNAGLSAVITEPKGRDTAAAAAIAAHWGAKIQAADPDEDYIVLLLPADHHISNIEGFHTAITAASEAALKGYISTIGITPNAPETGFGYINRASDKLPGLDSYLVKRFVEKPDAGTAQTYLESGDFLWNAGMFAFRPDVFLKELQAFEPEIAEKSSVAFHGALQIERTERVPRLDLMPSTFLEIPSLSVDYAVMERTDKASVLPAEFGWNDVGSWAAAHEIADTDENGNALVGDVVTIGTTNSFIKAYDKLIAAVDVENMIIVDTKNAILICPRGSSQKVKSVHERLSQMNHPSALHHGEGTYEHQKIVHEKACDWLFEKALPFWIEHGEDIENGGVYEALDLQGKPLPLLPKRTRVLARQTYVFAHCHMLGQPGCLEAMKAPLAFMLKHAHLGNGRYAHMLNPNGTRLDPHSDAYDHAFILLALAWAYKASGDPDLLKLAEQTMQFILTEMRHPLGGFREAIPETNALRRANPHMHLFEAAMAWMELHRHDRMAELAEEIFGLFKTKFCVNGLLREYFEDDLTPLQKSPSRLNLAVEPGHLYEWAYLLRKYQMLTGSRSEAPAIMEAFADTYGLSSQTGLVLDHVFPDGTPVDASASRLWPQTEYIRLKLYHSKVKPDQAAFRADEAATAMIERMMLRYFRFDLDMPGYWRDQINSQGVNLVDKSPASSLYHILGCFAPLLDRKL